MMTGGIPPGLGKSWYCPFQERSMGRFGILLITIYRDPIGCWRGEPSRAGLQIPCILGNGSHSDVLIGNTIWRFPKIWVSTVFSQIMHFHGFSIIKLLKLSILGYVPHSSPFPETPVYRKTMEDPCFFNQTNRRSPVTFPTLQWKN